MEDQVDLVMNVAIIALFAVGMAWAVSVAMGKGLVKKECKRHKWSHHPVNGKLTCQECGYVAGTPDKTESDEP